MLIKSSFIPRILVLFFVITLPFSLLTAQVNDDCPLFYELIEEADAATSYQEKFEKYSLAASEGAFCTQEQRDLAIKKQSELLIELDRIAEEAKKMAELNRKQAKENEFLAMQADSARLVAEELLLQHESILNIHRANGGYEFLLERGDSAFYHQEFENALINYRSALVLSNNDSLRIRISAVQSTETAYGFIQQGLIFEAKPYLEEVYALNSNLDFINESLAIIPSLDSLISVGLRGQPIHLAKVYDSPDALYFLSRELLKAKNLDTIKFHQEHLGYIPDFITELSGIKEIHLYDYELDERLFLLLSEMDSLENVQLFNCLATSLPKELDSTFLEKKFFLNDWSQNRVFFIDNIDEINFYINNDNVDSMDLTRMSNSLFYQMTHQYDGVPKDRLVNADETYYYRNISSYTRYSPKYYRKWIPRSTYLPDSLLGDSDSRVIYRKHGFIAFPDSSDVLLNSLFFLGWHKFISPINNLNQNDILNKLIKYNRRRRKALWHYTLYYKKYINLTYLSFNENPKLRKLPFDLTWFPRLKELHINNCSNVKELPYNLSELKNLEILSLYSVPIKKLPDSIGKMSQLKELHISSTKIKALPDSFYKLRQLTVLKCKSDVLHKVSSDFQLMDSLSRLIILAQKNKPIDWGTITSHRGVKSISIKVAWKNSYFKRYLIPIKRRHHFRLIRSFKRTQLNDNITELSLRFFRMNAIPKELFNLTGLRVLDVSGSDVSKIPSNIGQLKNLRELNLSSNRIKKHPNAIYSLDSLVNLNLRNNKIRILIDSFTEKQQVEIINLGNNKLRTLPESIGKLALLQELQISGNRIKELPVFIGRLKQLRELNIQNNKIKDLPSSFNQLENLIELDLSNNKIEYLPQTISQLNKLASLNLSNNKIKELLISSKDFKNLESLDLKNNRIENLPESIFFLPKLKNISIIGNNFDYAETLEIRKRFKDLGVDCEIKTRSYFRVSFQEGWQQMGTEIRRLFGR